MFIAPRSKTLAPLPPTTSGTGPRAARALPQSVRRPRPLAAPDPKRVANPLRAARSRSRVPTPPPIASHPRAAPSDRASQVAVRGISRDGLSATAMVRGPLLSVNRGRLVPLSTLVLRCRNLLVPLPGGPRVPLCACRDPPCALSAVSGVLEACAHPCGCLASHWQRRRRSPETHPETNASR